MTGREGDGWVAEYDPDSRECHILPVNDAMEHQDYGVGCNCNPCVEDQDLLDGETQQIIIHHSLDGREVPEPRQRRYVAIEDVLVAPVVLGVVGLTLLLRRLVTRRPSSNAPMQ